MTYHLLHPLCIFLLWNYYIRTVDSFHAVAWRLGSLHGFNINVLTKINRFYDLYFDTQQTRHDLHRHNPIPYYEQQIRKNDGTFGGCQGRAISQLHTKKGSNDDISFDFSSKIGWEEYYKRGLIADNNNNDGSSSSPSITTEWHTSIPLETISSYCWGDYAKHCKINSVYNDDTNSMNKSFLMIGCGTSHLVEVIMEGNPYNNTKSDNVQFTLLDSSQTCIDELTSRYKQFENIHCVCGDAIELTKTLSFPRQNANAAIPQRYDTIIDKGLMDVLFCSDDWTASVETLFTEATKVLVCGGTYILISDKIPKATKEFLTEIADGLGYAWHFNCIGSTERVTISIADQTNRCSV